MLVAGAPNEGERARSEAFPWSPLGSGRRPPLMLESLSQVGTNCHKVQNVLVAWGVCSLLTMPQPPWGGGKGSRSPDVRQLRRVWGWGVWVLFFFHAHSPSTEWETHYVQRAHAHTHRLLHYNFINSIMFDFFFNQRVSAVGGIMAKRKRKQTLAGRQQTDLDSSPSFATC